jgi:hypothetical protein
MKPSSSPRAGSEAPAPFQKLAKTLVGAGIPDPMSPWQIAGFAAGLVCGLGPAPELAFDKEEDPDQILALDCLDELSRRIEEHDAPVPPEDLLDGADGKDLSAQLVALVAAAESQMSAQAGHPELAFAAAAATAQNPALADVPAARAYARGLLRGLVMSVEDEEALSGENYGEPLSLIFILTEDDLGADFGSAAEVAEARQAVAMALPGLVAQLWTISHNEDGDGE